MFSILFAFTFPAHAQSACGQSECPVALIPNGGTTIGLYGNGDVSWAAAHNGKWDLYKSRNPLPTSGMRQIDSARGGNGDFYWCGIRDFTHDIVCGGYVEVFDRIGGVPEPGTGASDLLDPAVDMALGRHGGVAVDIQGRVYPWGRDSYGEATDAPATVAMPIFDLERNYHTVSAVDGNGDLQVWGLCDAHSTCANYEAMFGIASGEYLSHSNSRRIGAAVDIYGELTVVGLAGNANAQAFVTNAPVTTDAVSVEIGERWFGETAALVLHSDDTVTVWSDSGAASKIIQAHPENLTPPQQNVPNLRSSFKVSSARVVGPDVCVVIKEDSTGTYNEGDQICWGNTMSPSGGNGTPKVFTCP